MRKLDPAWGYLKRLPMSDVHLSMNESTSERIINLLIAILTTKEMGEN
jgi:hypothetical protein